MPQIVRCFFRILALMLLIFGEGRLLHAQAPTAPPPQAGDGVWNFIPLSDFNTSNSQTPMVRAAINGRSYWFMVDTGAVISLLKQSVSREAKLTPIDAPTIPSGSNLANRLLIDGKYQGVFVPRFTAGNFAIPNAPFYLAPDALFTPLLPDDPSVAGVIGMNMLVRLAVSFDFEHRTILLVHEGNITEAKRAALGFGGKDTLVAPLTVLGTDGGKFVVSALLGGKPASLLLDTGADGTTVAGSLQDFGISPSAAKENPILSVSGKTSVFSAPVKLTLGTVSIPDVSVGFNDTSMRPGEGRLGTNFLSRYYVLIDFPARKLYLRPRNSGGK